MHRTRLSVGSVLALTVSAGIASAGPPLFSNTLGTPGFSGSYVASFAVHDDGSGEALYATGQFTATGAAGTTNLARWNGAAWEGVGGGLPGQYSNALTTYQGDLIAGGYFDSAGGVPGTAKLARWDGTQWNSMDAQSDSFLNSIWDLTVWDDGNGEKLYIAGNYLDLGGVGGPDHLASWDGSTYAPLGAPIGGAVPLIVLDIQVADLGDGEKLYAGGRFLNIDGIPANNIAVWDGSSWSAMGSGVTRPSGISQVLTMTVFDDGSGDALYVGGRFETAGGVPASRIAKWDGSSWSAVGAGFNSDVQELTVFDDGSGPALYASGNFEAANGGIDHIAKWNGSSWEQVGSGANANVFGAIVYDAGEGPALHFAGSFTQAGGLATNRVVSLLAQGDPGCNAADNSEPFGVLDLSDVQGFVAAFIGQQAPADIAPPAGVWDLADVQAFVAAFTAGCP